MSDDLSSCSLLDCQGRTTHRLVLRPDGLVSVSAAGVEAVVDPVRRAVVRPAGYRLPDTVVERAVTLSRDGVA